MLPWTFLLQFTLGVTLVSSSWTDLKHSHKITSKTPKYTRIASLSTTANFKKLLKPMLIERVSDSDGNLCVQDHIKTEMSKLNWKIEDDSFTDKTPYGYKYFRNIIATQNPSAKRQLVLACHFDSKHFEKKVFIGATDSAVPCAMLLDLAQSIDLLFRRSPGKSGEDISLQFVFFDGEEAFVKWTDTDSIYGARHLAKVWEETDHPLDPSVKRLHGMDVMVLLDLLGTSDCKIRNWFAPTSNLFKRLQYIEKSLHKKKLLTEHPSETMYFVGGFEFSGGIEDDHIPFLRRSARILHLIPYPFPTVWHTLKDDETALDYNTISNLNAILRVFVVEYLNLEI